MKLVSDLETAFVRRIEYMLSGYTEGRIIFDRYIDQSLKNKTRQKRATTIFQYDIHPDTKLNMSLKELLSSSSTKRALTKLLARDLVTHFKDSSCIITIVYDNIICCQEFEEEHGHEEADTLIAHQVLAPLLNNPEREILCV